MNESKVDEAKIPPLVPTTIAGVPINSHALAWSCDGELAVVTQQTIHVLLPHYPTKKKASDEQETEESKAGLKAPSQFSKASTRIATMRSFDAETNAKLFAAAGMRLPPPMINQYKYPGVGDRSMSGWGAMINQPVAVAWSPNGVGHNLRPILLVLVTGGMLVAFGQEAVSGHVSSLSSQQRGFMEWRVLWGVGANMTLPDGGSSRNDRIKSFAWAGEIGPGRGLLAYLTDNEEVVLIAVQYLHLRIDSPDQPKNGYGWQVKEVERFNASGPHGKGNIFDPDFVPYDSSFGVSWGPWLVEDHKRVAVMSYLARNYVGFRQIRIDEEWERGSDPKITTGEKDILGVCTFLHADAWVSWEDHVWSFSDTKVVRGVIVTPLEAKPFEIALGQLDPPSEEQHSTNWCNTTYPEESRESMHPLFFNPIMDLTIHRQSSSEMPPLQYSVVRASATKSNDDWFQSNAYEAYKPPRWANLISRVLKTSISTSLAIRDQESGSESGSDTGDDGEDDGDMPADAGEQVQPYRFRIWALAQSPGGGTTAVLVSRHNTLRPAWTARTQILFGAGPGDVATDPLQLTRLTAEGAMWESMYRGDSAADGDVEIGMIDPALMPGHSPSGDNALQQRFKQVAAAQRCVYCHGGLKRKGAQSVCPKGHKFSRCTATGLAILEPGVSRACGLCSLRCHFPAEVERIAREQLSGDPEMAAMNELCTACGGKFVL